MEEKILINGPEETISEEELNQQAEMEYEHPPKEGEEE